MINGHGDDSFRYNGKITSNFSSNVYNDVDLNGLKTYLSENINCISSYPEPEPYSLEQQIAAHLNIENENVCVTNGATEGIYLIAQYFRGGRSVIFAPTFSEYGDACKNHNHKIIFVTSLEEIERTIKKSEVTLVWLCNPNNPTGLVHDKRQLISLIRNFRKTTFIIDQSYEYFTRKQVIGAKEGVESSNLILLHSMTKKYAIPGLRLGFMSGYSEIIRAVSSGRMPWSVNALACEAGKYLLSHNKECCADIGNLLAETDNLASELASITYNGDALFEVLPTDTHYMLVKILNRNGEQRIAINAPALKDTLAKEYGILIRDASNFPSLNDSYFRIATQSKEENAALVKAIRQIFIK